MRYLLSIILVLNGVLCQAQSSVDSVKAAVNELFTAMRNSDSSALVSCFTDSGILQTIVEAKENGVVVKSEPLHTFGSVIAKIKKSDADERIVFDIVKVDGPLAMVWAPYEFYYQGNFSHCGIDCFQLVRNKGKWKIQYLIDTRRKEGCK